MMHESRESREAITILMADDDADDRDLTRDAFDDAHLANDLRFAVDGEDLMDYLLGRGAYTDPKLRPRPSLILLDLNMPRKDGREALREIKEHPDLRQIPVVVLTTSDADEDIWGTYDLGVNSFIRKPVTFEALASVVATLSTYWFEIVRLPK